MKTCRIPTPALLAVVEGRLSGDAGGSYILIRPQLQPGHWRESSGWRLERRLLTPEPVTKLNQAHFNFILRTRHRPIGQRLRF